MKTRDMRFQESAKSLQVAEKKQVAPDWGLSFGGTIGDGGKVERLGGAEERCSRRNVAR